MRRIVAEAMEAGAAGFSLVARADPARRRRPPRPQPVRLDGRARGAVRRGRPPQRGVDQLPPPQRHRRARPARQGPALPAGHGRAACPSSCRASGGVPRSTCRARSGSRCRSGSRRSGARVWASSRCCATTPSTATSGSTPAPTSTKACRPGTRRWAPVWPGRTVSPCCGIPRRARRCATPWSTPTPTARRGRRFRPRAGAWSRSTRSPKPTTRSSCAAPSPTSPPSSARSLPTCSSTWPSTRTCAPCSATSTRAGRGRRPWPTARATPP